MLVLDPYPAKFNITIDEENDDQIESKKITSENEPLI